MTSIKSKNVVFITGAFVSHTGWDEWKSYFNEAGYKTEALPWPYKEGTAKELRSRHGYDTNLAKLTLDQLVTYYANSLKKYPEKPIVIGHSLGGLVAQILLNKGLASAGVAIHPVPPMGIFPYEWSFLRSTWKAIGLFTSLDKTYMMSFKDFQYAFVNGMSLADQKAAYEDNAIPESKRVSRGGLTSAAKVDFKKQQPPLLITSGSTDHIIPAHLNNRNYKRYNGNKSVVDYKEFPNRNHFVLGLPTWKEDADYIIDWLKQN